MALPQLSSADDQLHPSAEDFYHTETFWYCFQVPAARMAGWLYAAVRPTVGVTSGGMWIWDDKSSTPWDALFYENFSHLKLPAVTSEQRIEMPTGMSVETIEPLSRYQVSYDDRDGVSVDLHFEALEPPQVLRRGTPPYTRAGHFDQTGRLTGRLQLHGDLLEVACFAMRDRSWGPRPERGLMRMNYTWLAGEEASALVYSSPGLDDVEAVHAGYARQGSNTAVLVSGERITHRDRERGWVTAVDLRMRGEDGRSSRANAEVISRLVLPLSTGICIISTLRWEFDGRAYHGEDQDIWPMRRWRQWRRGSRHD